MSSSEILLLLDYCSGAGDGVLPQLQSKVCIKRYNTPTKLPNGSFYFVAMQPLPNDFNLVMVDLNVLHMPRRVRRLFVAADTRNESLFRVGHDVYPTEFFRDTHILVVYNMFAKRRQRLANGLVMKLVKYEIDQVNYVVCGPKYAFY